MGNKRCLSRIYNDNSNNDDDDDNKNENKNSLCLFQGYVSFVCKPKMFSY